MRKHYILLGLCLASVAGFSQTQQQSSPQTTNETTQNAVQDAAKDPKAMENSAKADVILVDKKAVVTEKRKRPRRTKLHKECSRMKI